MIQGSAQVRPSNDAASIADGKCADRSSRVTARVRSRSQPARANSGTQIQSSIITSKPGRRPRG